MSAEKDTDFIFNELDKILARYRDCESLLHDVLACLELNKENLFRPDELAKETFFDWLKRWQKRFDEAKA